MQFKNTSGGAISHRFLTENNFKHRKSTVVTSEMTFRNNIKKIKAI